MDIRLLGVCVDLLSAKYVLRSRPSFLALCCLQEAKRLKPEDYFDTDKELLDRAFNRPRRAQLESQEILPDTADSIKALSKAEKCVVALPSYFRDLFHAPFPNTIAFLGWLVPSVLPAASPCCIIHPFQAVWSFSGLVWWNSSLPGHRTSPGRPPSAHQTSLFTALVGSISVSESLVLLL